MYVFFFSKLNKIIVIIKKIIIIIIIIIIVIIIIITTIIMSWLWKWTGFTPLLSSSRKIAFCTINKQIATYKNYYLRLRFHPNGYTISFLTIIIIIIIIY